MFLAEGFSYISVALGVGENWLAHGGSFEPPERGGGWSGTRASLKLLVQHR